MKKLFFIVNLLLVFCCSNSQNNENSDSNSDCINSNYNHICWTIVDNNTGDPITYASVILTWGNGFGNLISGGSTDGGLICFCWRNNWDVISGGISAEGYEWMDLTGIIPIDISTIKLVPSN